MFLTNLQQSLDATPSPYTSNLQPFLRKCISLGNNLNDITLKKLELLSSGRTHYIQLNCDFLSQIETKTPSNLSDIDVKPGYTSEAIIGTLAASLGGIFGYKEQNGFIVHDIFPVKGLEFSNTGANSINELCFHTDGATHPVYTPDYVILFCLKSDPRAHNYIASLKDLLDSLPTVITDELKKPHFKHKIDDELRVHNKQAYSVRPVITLDKNNKMAIKFDADLVSGINDTSRQAIKQLKFHIDKVSIRVNNTSNSVLVLNNNACLHARSAFKPKYDGTDRWLQSAFVSKDRNLTGRIIEVPQQRVKAKEPVTMA